MKTVHFEGGNCSDLDELWAYYAVAVRDIGYKLDILQREKNRLDFCYEACRRELLKET